MKEQFANEETRVSGGISALVWVLALSGVLGASAVCFVCSLFLETFAAHFYTCLFAGGAAGIVLAAVILAVTGKMKTLGSGASAKAVIVLAALAVFFMAGSAFMIAEKDTKAPIIAFSDETVTMREGDPESVLYSNMIVSDDRDGDIRDQLSVVSFVYSGDGKTADVTYAAADSSGNRATASQRIYVEGKPWPEQ